MQLWVIFSSILVFQANLVKKMKSFIFAGGTTDLLWSHHTCWVSRGDLNLCGFDGGLFKEAE